MAAPSHPLSEGHPPEDSPPTTRDLFFGGRLLLEQPRGGHRSGTDAVLLAAAVPPSFAGRAVDVGAGVGAVGLCVALAHPAVTMRLLERDPATATLAQSNVVANGLAERVSVATCDVLVPSARRAACAEPADLVLTNPPFFDASETRTSPEPGRRAARTLDAPLADWIAACLDLLAPGGTLIVIYAAPAIPVLLAVLAGRAGAVVLKGIHPRHGVPARRVLVRATAGSRAPFTLAAPLILHAGDAFTAEAEALQRGEGALVW